MKHLSCAHTPPKPDIYKHSYQAWGKHWGNRLSRAAAAHTQKQEKAAPQLKKSGQKVGCKT